MLERLAIEFVSHHPCERPCGVLRIGAAYNKRCVGREWSDCGACPGFQGVRLRIVLLGRFVRLPRRFLVGRGLLRGSYLGDFCLL